MVEIKCRVCDFPMGEAEDLQAQVAAAGHDTPESWGLDPGEVTWYHGTHIEDIGDPDWDQDEPYWKG